MTATTGRGVLIISLVSIAAFAQIEDFVSINRNACVGHHTVIGDFVTINPGANVAGLVRIGKKSIIGMGANSIDGITIGKNTIVGAGSLVTRNLPVFADSRRLLLPARRTIFLPECLFLTILAPK